MISRISPDPSRRSSLTTLAWALSLLLLPPLACTGAATPGGEAADEAPAAQRDLLELLPASARAVAHVDVDAIRGGALFDLFVGDDGVVEDSDDLREFVDRTGIDPRRDLRRVAFASLTGDTGLEGSVVLAEATFDRARLEEALAELPSEQWSGRTVYALGSWSREPAPGEPDAPEEPATPEAPDAEEDTERESDDPDVEVRSGHLVVLEDDLVAAGSATGVRSVLEVLGGAASVRSDPELSQLIRDAQPAEAEVWAVSSHEEFLGAVGSPQGIPVDKIRALLLSIDLDDGIAASLRGRTGSEEDAELLGESLRGMLALGKMMLQKEHPEIFEIVDRGIRAGSSGYDVTLRATLAGEDLETLRTFARRQLDGEDEGTSTEG